MNELRVNGTQLVNGLEVKVVEGGFGEGKKCILATDIASQHGGLIGDLNVLINKNISRFNENDIVDFLNGQQPFRDFAKENGLITSNRTKNIYLLSERGYTKLVAMMDNTNDKKWEVMDNLIEEYFTMRKIINSDEQMKAQLLMSIYNGGQEGIVASAKLTEIEKKPLLETIAIQAPRVEYAEEVLESEGTFTITQIAKELFLSGRELNNRLHELNVQYKVNGQWVLYSKHDNKGYIDTKTFVVDGHSRVSTRWTNLGREFIHNLMKKEW